MTRPQDLDLEGEENVFQRPRTALIPMMMGPLSAFGSYLVIRELWRDRVGHSSPQMTTQRSTMRAPVVRALLMISLVDFFASIAIGLTTVPTPASQTHVPYAIGTHETCEAQGFLLQLAVVAIPLYMVLLVFFYLVIIKHQWTDTRIRTVEMRSHWFIIILSLGCAIFPIPLEIYNNPYHYCWIASYPLGCEWYDEDVECERGRDSYPFFAFFTVIPLWPALFAVSVIMWKVFSAVRNAEASAADRSWGVQSSMETFKSNEIHESDEWNESKGMSKELNKSKEMKVPSVPRGRPNQPEDVEDPSVTVNTTTTGATEAIQEVNRNRSRAVARQAMFFVMAFVVSNILRLVASLWFVATDGLYNPPLLVMALDVMQPLQGVFNAIALLNSHKLHTPEGKFVQRLYDALCSRMSRVNQKINSFCLCCRRHQESSHQGALEPPPQAPTATSATMEKSTPGEASDHIVHEKKEWSMDIVGKEESRLFNESNLQGISSADPDDSIAERERAALAMLNDDEESGTTASTQAKANMFLARDSLGGSNVFNDSFLNNISSAGPDDSIAERERAALAMLKSSEEPSKSLEWESNNSVYLDRDSAYDVANARDSMFKESDLPNSSSAGPGDSIVERERAALAMLQEEESSTEEGEKVIGARESNATAFLDKDSAYDVRTRDSMFNDSVLQNISSAGPDDSIFEREQAALALLEESEFESNHGGFPSRNSLDLNGASDLFNDSVLQNNVSSVGPEDSMAEMETAVAAVLNHKGSIPKGESATESVTHGDDDHAHEVFAREISSSRTEPRDGH